MDPTQKYHDEVVSEMERIERELSGEQQDAPMMAMPLEMRQQQEISRLGVRLDVTGDYMDKFAQHADHLLELLMDAVARRDFLQDQVSRDAFTLDAARENLRTMAGTWEGVLKVILDRQEIVKNAIDELLLFMHDAGIGSNSNEEHCLRIRLGQIKNLVDGRREEAPGQMPNLLSDDEISRYVKTGSKEFEPVPPSE